MDFWARRRAAVEAEAKAEEAERIEDVRVAREAELEEKSDAELLEEFGLPEPETLGPEDDFKAFMADGVPRRLKTRALRCLWRSNPVLANVDGLVDYGQDFTDAACVVENLQTAYQVGKGMLSHIEHLARKAAEQEDAAIAAEEQNEDVDAASEAVADAADPIADEGASESLTITAAEPLPELEEDAVYAPPRRRMAFTFETTEA